MIQANELRKGNLVSFGINEVVYLTVETIGENGINGKYNIDEDFVAEGVEYSPYFDEYKFKDIDPIPLTPEILEQAGLYTPNSRGQLEIGSNTISFRAMLNEAKEGNITFEIITEEIENSFFLPVKVKHLHQLQNIYFALTGEELEINL